MLLYHFTSRQHLRGISQYGLTVGDVPTDLFNNQGRCGIWLTSSDQAEGHGLSGSLVDKTRFRLRVEVPESKALVRWIDWSKTHCTKETIRRLQETAKSFDSWFVYFGIINPSDIRECIDLQHKAPFDQWPAIIPAPDDRPGVAPDGRRKWHRKLLKSVRRAVERDRCHSGANLTRTGFLST